MTQPISGTGLYLRGLSTKMHGRPVTAAKKAKDHGVSNVALMITWQDVQNGKFRHLSANLDREVKGKPLFAHYAEAFREAGIGVGFWFYPWGGGEDRLLADLERACEEFAPDFLLDDGELGHKWGSRSAYVDPSGTMRGGQREAFKGGKAEGTKALRIGQVEKLHKGLHDLATAYSVRHGIGVTAYGIADFHPTFPWETKLAHADFFSPQLYRATPERIDMGIAQWYKHARVDRDVVERPMIPSIPTFGKSSGAKLDEYLGTFMDAKNGVDGFLAWSWRQTSRREWRILATWAERLQRGAFKLPTE